MATLPGSSDAERLLVVLRQKAAGGSHLELRQQSFGEGVGWFTQSTVQVTTAQVAELRNLLGANSGLRPGRPSPRPGGFVPRVVCAESA